MRKDQLPRHVAAVQLGADLSVDRYLDQLRDLLGPLAAESEERRLLEIKLRRKRTQMLYLLESLQPQTAVLLLEACLRDQRERISAE